MRAHAPRKSAEFDTRPGNSALCEFLSSLDLSNQGWEQIANFLVFGFAGALNPTAPVGLPQRTAIIAGWVWIALFAWRLLRQRRPR